MELLSKGIRLEICEDASQSSPVWRNLYGLSSTPDIGGDPEKIEVTNLADGNKRYIDGILDYGDLEFGFFYNKEDTPDEEASVKIMESYAVLRAYQQEGTQLDYRLVYPDNTGHQWKGSVNVKRSAAAVNAALEFTLTTSLSSEMKDITVTAG